MSGSGFNVSFGEVNRLVIERTFGWTGYGANFSSNLEPELIPSNGKLSDRARDPPKQGCRTLVEGPRTIQFLYLFWGERIL